jgi:hypothetical protein
MTTRPADERARRAEARRRARLAARGEYAEPEPEAREPEDPPPRGGFLSRLFPPAPPLPNRPDPLAGFDPDGPLRPVRERLFLLRRSPLAWILPAIGALVGNFAFRFYDQGLLGLLGMVLMFGALIAAGWYGWRRPTLYGAAAGLLAFAFLATLVIVDFTVQGAGPATFTAPQLLISIVMEAAYQTGLGFIGGWYGGYLRRRQTAISGEVRRRR